MVRLISLEIVNFKQLQKGQIKWNPSARGLSAISVRDFYQRTTLFEAFQFGFGHDTDAEEAETIVTLRNNDGNMIRFKHSKNVQMDNIQSTYEKQADGVDDDFQVLDQKSYFDQLAQLNVFACAQTFLFGGGAKNNLATNFLDLRSFLEMHLLQKDWCDDYDDVDRKKEKRKRELADMKKVANCINLTQEIFQTLNDEREKERQNEQDFCYWKLYAHSKEKEDLEQKINVIKDHIDDSDDLQHLLEITEMIANWMDKVECNNHLVQTNNFKANTKARLDARQRQGKRIQNEIDIIKDDIRVLTTVKFAPLTRTRQYAQFKHDKLGLFIDLKDLRIQLSIAELEHESKYRDDDRMEIETYANPFVSKLMECNEILKSMQNLRDEASDKAQLSTLRNAKPYDIKMDEIDPDDDNFKSFLNQLPTDGMIKIHTKSQRTIRPEDIGNRIVLQIDDSHVVPTNYSPFGHVITADEPSMYDTTYFDASLQVKICNVEMQIHTISPIINRIEQAAKLQITHPIEKEATVTENQEALELQAKLHEKEEEFARIFSSEFNRLMPELDFEQLHENKTKAIMMAINCFNRHQDVLTDNVLANIQKKVERLRQTMIGMERELQEVMNLRLSSRFDIDQESLADSIRDEAMVISEYAVERMKNVYAKANLSICKVFIAGKEQAISYVKEEIKEKNWETPNNFDNETSSEAFYQFISADNAAVFYDSTRNNVESFAESYKILESHLKQVSTIEDAFVYHNDNKLKSIGRKNVKDKKAANREMVAENKSHKLRCDAFNNAIQELQIKFTEVAAKCSPVTLSLDLQFDLNQPIHLLVDDQVNNPGNVNVIATFSQHVAALILKLAMNLTIHSPILIFDSLDYVTEPQLISPFIAYLQELVGNGNVQVIFMLLKPQEDLSILNAHHMWIDEKNIEQIADTSDLFKDTQEEEGISEFDAGLTPSRMTSQRSGPLATSSSLPTHQVQTSASMPPSASSGSSTFVMPLQPRSGPIASSTPLPPHQVQTSASMPPPPPPSYGTNITTSTPIPKK